MPSFLLDGIMARRVQTDRLNAQVLERVTGDSAGADPSSAERETRETVVFIHGNVSSSLFWQPAMLRLPADMRALANDLRGFGDSETLPVDATRGLSDYADDVASILDTLVFQHGERRVNLVGWSMGGGVALQYLLDHPDTVASVTLQSPVSPYGFGGTTGPDGRMLTPDGAGTGAGGANPDFVARLTSGDRSDEAPTSPRNVYRGSYVLPGFASENEDLWVESMLTTKTGEDNYPGDAVASKNWPGFAPGRRGVLNTMAPQFFNVSGIVGLSSKPPVLWIRGLDDAIVSDNSFFDLNMLGQAGILPDWPGADVAPPQPMIAQTRAVLDAYRAAGGTYRELALADCGHSPHLEHPDEFNAALIAVISTGRSAI